MTLDLATLLAATMAAATAQALPIVFVALRARLHRGLALWGLGLVVNALSYPAFGLRAFGWTEVSILATNLLSGLTLVLHTLAIASFQRHRAQPVRSALVWLPLAVNMVVVLWFMRDDHWRNILVAGIQSVMAGMLLYQAWGPALVERRLTGRWVLIAGCAGLVLTLVVRTAYMVWASDWDAVYNVPGQVQGLTYFAVMAVLLVNSMGFVLMQMEFALEQQHALATHDSLTGLYNRSALQDLLPALGARARRQGEPLAFLMLDIDHFKRVNDTYGHLAGDAVLREVALRIRQRLRQADVVARYGGEEFLAVLPATDQAGALRLAEHVRKAIESPPVRLANAMVSITLSVGVHAGIPDDSPRALDAQIGLSDEALYAAKNAGRNRVEWR